MFFDSQCSMKQAGTYPANDAWGQPHFREGRPLWTNRPLLTYVVSLPSLPVSYSHFPLCANKWPPNPTMRSAERSDVAHSASPGVQKQCVW